MEELSFEDYHRKISAQSELVRLLQETRALDRHSLDLAHLDTLMKKAEEAMSTLSLINKREHDIMPYKKLQLNEEARFHVKLYRMFHDAVIRVVNKPRLEAIEADQASESGESVVVGAPPIENANVNVVSESLANISLAPAVESISNTAAPESIPSANEVVDAPAAPNEPIASTSATAQIRHGSGPPLCRHCGEDHMIFHCMSFRSMQRVDRLTKIIKWELCINCLRSGHKAEQCWQPSGCAHCSFPQKHNSIVCVYKPYTPRQRLDQ